MAIAESLLISLFANVVTNEAYKVIRKRNLVEALKKCYTNAVNRWASNERARHIEKLWTRSRIELLLKCVENAKLISSLDSEIKDLMNFFREEIYKDQVCFNLISDLQNQKTLAELGNINIKLDKLLTGKISETEKNDGHLIIEAPYDINTINDLVKKSSDLYSQGLINESFSQIQVAYKIAPLNPDVIEKYSTVLFRNAEFERVQILISDYKKSGKPVIPQILRTEAEIYRRKHEFSKSIEILKVIKDKGLYNIDYQIGVNYLFLYKKERNHSNLIKAKQALMNANQSFPRLWHVKVNLAIAIRLCDGKPDKSIEQEAIKLLNIKIRNHPHKVSARLYRLLFYAMIDDSKKFEEMIQEDNTTDSKERLLTIDFIDTTNYRIELIHSDSDKKNYYIDGFKRWSSLFSINYQVE